MIASEAHFGFNGVEKLVGITLFHQEHKLWYVPLVRDPASLTFVVVSHW